MSQPTYADSGVLESVAQKFEGANTAIQSMMGNLRNRIAELQGTWAGSGALAFGSTMEKYDTDLRNMNDALLKTAEAIRNSGRGYTSTDTAAASRANAIQTGTTSLPL